MSRPIRLLTFGGCGLNNMVATLSRSKETAMMYAEMGFRNTPFALSSPASVQLLDFVTLRRVVPAFVRRLCYGDPKHVPNEKQAQVAATADIVVVEMSTPIEYLYDDFVLNINRFEEVMLPALKDYDIPPKLVSRWRSALLKNFDDKRTELAAQLLEMMPELPEKDAWIRAFLAHTHSRYVTSDRMVEDLDEIRARSGVQLALIHHNFQYMPDGRPVSWPPEFKGLSLDVAKRLQAPALDFAPFVQEHGTSRVMASDNRHWNPDFYEKISEHFLKFLRGTLGDYEGDVGAPPPAKRVATRAPTPDKEKLARDKAPILLPAACVDSLFHHPTGSHLPIDPDVLLTVIVLGQSWATGSNGDMDDFEPATPTPEHPGHALMFDAGAVPRGRKVSHFTDLHERVLSSMKESPCSGAADQIMRTCEKRFGQKPKMLFFSVGRGGTTVAGIGQTAEDGLLKGSVQHQETMRLVQAATKIAGEQGMRVRVLAICFAQGEADSGFKTPFRDYQRRVILLRQAYEADIRAISGQTEAVPLLTYQTNRGPTRVGIEPTIPQAQLHLSDIDPLIRCIGPVYSNEPENRPDRRATHLKAIGYRRIGQQFGRFIVDDVLGAGREPLRIVSCTFCGVGRIMVDYTRPIVLERDDTLVNVSDLGPGLGLDVADGTSISYEIASVEVSQLNPARLDIRLSAHPRGKRPQLFVASRSTGGAGCGRFEGVRSGIRSLHAFDVDPKDGAQLYDWACSEAVDIR